MDFGEDDAAARAARISHAQAVKSKLSDAKTRQRGQPYIKVDEFEARLEPTLAPSASIFAQTGISPMTTCRRTEQGRGKTWGHGGSMRHARTRTRTRHTHLVLHRTPPPAARPRRQVRGGARAGSLRPGDARRAGGHGGGGVGAAEGHQGQSWSPRGGRLQGLGGGLRHDG